MAAMESRKMIREVVEADENRTGKCHGRIEAMLIFLRMCYVLPRKLGHIYPGDTIRVPDVSFVAAGWEDEQNPDEAHYLAPDLAIERC